MTQVGEHAPIKDVPNVDFDYDFYDPTEVVIEEARRAAKSGDSSGLHALLERMKVVNGTGVNCRDAFTFQTPLHFAAIAGETEVIGPKPPDNPRSCTLWALHPRHATP